MKAKLYVCDSGDSYRTAHNMYISKSYAECTIFDLIVEDVDVDCSSTHFNNFALKYRCAGLSTPTGCGLCGWQNFLLKFENGEVAELHRSQDVLYRHDDCTANREAISRFKEDIATAIAGKPELIFSEEEDFVV